MGCMRDDHEGRSPSTGSRQRAACIQKEEQSLLAEELSQLLDPLSVVPPLASPSAVAIIVTMLATIAVSSLLLEEERLLPGAEFAASRCAADRSIEWIISALKGMSMPPSTNRTARSRSFRGARTAPSINTWAPGAAAKGASRQLVLQKGPVRREPAGESGLQAKDAPRG